MLEIKDLKPCPFCGGNNIKMYAGRIGPECSIACTDCNVWLEIEVPWHNMTEEEHDKACWDALEKAWNRRLDDD